MSRHANKSRAEYLSENYRRVEALYRQGVSSRDIADTYDLPIEDVLDIEQKIFATDMKRKGLK